LTQVQGAPLKGAPLKAPLKEAHSMWLPLRGPHSKGPAPKGGPHTSWLPLKKAPFLVWETSKRDPLCRCRDPLNGAPLKGSPT
jgi:hypothetical protein